MVLSNDQIRERIKNPVNRIAIEDAVDHEDRIKLHTKAVHKLEKAPKSFNKFLEWVNNGIKLPIDKQEAFKGMCRFPLPTASLSNSIFEEYEKIFTAQDSYRDYQLLSDTFKEEFKEYVESVINVHGYFKGPGFKSYKKQPNCIFIIDLPAAQTTPRPQPYFYKVPISQVHDISIEKMNDNKERIGFIAFTTGNNRMVVIDDAAYYVYIKTKEGEDWTLQFFSNHNIGYTPAVFFCQEHVYDEDDNNPITRKTMISDSIGNFDWLLFYKIAERMYETYGPFPITTVPSFTCEYADAKTNNRCKQGIVAYIKDDGSSGYYDCPVCKKNNMVGPGTIFERAVPRTKDDAVLTKAVETTPADVDSLKYITEKIDFLEWEIYADCVGSDDDMVTKEAVNEDQVQNSVEGKRNVLMRVKKDFEQVEKFIIDTMGRLMYGDYYVGSTINYGEQFLLYTAEDVTYQFTEFKKAGLPNFLVSQKKQLLIQTEYKNNPYQQQRAVLLNLLEPWPDLSPNECKTYLLDQKFPDKFLLKLNFANFVSNFELANGDIVQWGSAISLEQKVNRLNQIFITYGKEESKSAVRIEPAGPATGQPAGTK